MDTAHTVALIVNPAAGRGRAAQISQRIAARLDAEHVRHTIYATSGPGDATILTRQALREGAATVASIGGDGTLHEVVNGAFDAGLPLNSDARFAFIAAGTGNDASREFPGHEAALLNGRSESIDLLRIRYTTSSAGVEGERYAVFHAGVGLVTEVVEASDQLKHRLGRFVYIGGSVVALYRHRPGTIRYSCDDGPATTQSIALIIVANGRYAGGGMKIAPKASMVDGYLDVVTLQGASRAEMLLRLLPAVYRGAHVNHPAFRHTQARSVHIESEVPLTIQSDGELAGTTPATIEVCPGALRVCAGG